MKRKIAAYFVTGVMSVALIGCNTEAETSVNENSESEVTAEAEVEEISSDASSEETSATLTVESDILGMADTGNKTSLKKDLIYTSGPGDINLYYYNEDGERVQYENQQELTIALDPVSYSGSALMSLEIGDNGTEIDDNLIDSSSAVVKLLDGNSYYAEEFVLAATTLDGEWTNGTYTYTLQEGDLEWNTWDYDTSIDYNSDREWSIMGGDGNGVYNFRFEVSGITYDGVEVEPAVFPVTVYIYGRTVTDLALGTEFVENTYDESYVSGKEQTEEIQWTWTTENEASLEAGKPYLNDMYTDYFSVTWPEGTDASSLTADDVTITLKSKYGDEYVLSTESEYGEHEYNLTANADETEIYITYQQWAYVPVYSTMEIAINSGDLQAKAVYDIASVNAYMVQTGGGGVEIDHTVTAYNYYGLSDLTIQNAANVEYTLSTEIDGVTYWYSEDDEGNGSLIEGVASEGANGQIRYSEPEEVWTADGTEIYNIAVYGNVVFSEKRVGEEATEEKEVDGETITFNRSITVTKSIADIVASGASLEDGFNVDASAVSYWAWTTRYQSGWTTYDEEPTEIPYVEGYYGYGYEAGSTNPSYDKSLAE